MGLRAILNGAFASLATVCTQLLKIFIKHIGGPFKKIVRLGTKTLENSNLDIKLYLINKTEILFIRTYFFLPYLFMFLA